VGPTNLVDLSRKKKKKKKKKERESMEEGWEYMLWHFSNKKYTGAHTHIYNEFKKVISNILKLNLGGTVNSPGATLNHLL
jgi:hypothetical protein